LDFLILQIVLSAIRLRLKTHTMTEISIICVNKGIGELKIPEGPKKIIGKLAKASKHKVFG
jgi:hypothetical protein